MVGLVLLCATMLETWSTLLPHGCRWPAGRLLPLSHSRCVLLLSVWPELLRLGSCWSMSPCVAVGGAECGPSVVALRRLPAQPGMRWGWMDFWADAVCMLAPLSEAAHESGGLFESAGSMVLPFVYKTAVVTVSPSLSSTNPSPGFIKGHKQVRGDICVPSPPPCPPRGRHRKTAFNTHTHTRRDNAHLSEPFFRNIFYSHSS